MTAHEEVKPGNLPKALARVCQLYVTHTPNKMTLFHTTNKQFNSLQLGTRLTRFQVCLDECSKICSSCRLLSHTLGLCTAQYGSRRMFSEHVNHGSQVLQSLQRDRKH